MSVSGSFDQHAMRVESQTVDDNFLSLEFFSCIPYCYWLTHYTIKGRPERFVEPQEPVSAADAETAITF